MQHAMRWLAFAGFVVACAHQGSGPTGDDDDDPGVPPIWEPGLGAHYSPSGDEVSFRIASTRATRIELAIYAAPTQVPELLRRELTADEAGVFSTRISALVAATQASNFAPNTSRRLCLLASDNNVDIFEASMLLSSTCF